MEAAKVIDGLRRDSAITAEVSKNIKILWKDPGVLAAFEMRARFATPDSCKHFFDDIDRIGRENYDPTIQVFLKMFLSKKKIYIYVYIALFVAVFLLFDILLVRKRTTGIVEEHFTINLTHFHIFDVGGQRNERKKWIHCFENVCAFVGFILLCLKDK
ncbi:guanine nucleotide binding protein [Reticulomyxa filosa]|uniref:Guanine nucleotide binding protein n=1 Tax=Reticulomyxa filosa TaxID=46433 RepID=X6N2N3_RETFI|nr:guanine nucleotide binding protein [Reticulomyxa filosa]|eukprot:ETO19572.1 guanine nucleotide binding protein [Reticulomyxa filosa]